MTDSARASAESRGGGERHRARWSWGRWALVYALVAFAFWGVRPLWESTEARYAEVGRQMAVSGDYLIPRLDGREHLTKPPVTYWLIAGGIDLLGANEWGARFGQSVAFFGAMGAVAGLSRAWAGRREGAQREAGLAGLIFGTSVIPFTSGHYLTTDMALTALTTVGVLSAWRVRIASSAAEASRWRWACWLAFGLAFETKGPPGLLPLVALAVFSILERFARGRRDAVESAEPRPHRLWAPAPIAACIVVSLAWYIAIAALRPGAFDYFVKGEVLDRLFRGAGVQATGMREAVHQRHNGAWIYGATIIGGLYPWVFLWPQLVRRGASRLRGGWRPLRPEERFTAVWVVTTLAALAGASSRMPLYALPLFAPLAAWGARALVNRVEQEMRETRWIRWSARAMLGAGAVVMLAFLVFPDAPRWPRALVRAAPGVLDGAPPSYRGFARDVARLRESSGAMRVEPAPGAEWPRSVQFSLGEAFAPAPAQPSEPAPVVRVVVVGPIADAPPGNTRQAGAPARHGWGAWVSPAPSGSAPAGGAKE